MAKRILQDNNWGINSACAGTRAGHSCHCQKWFRPYGPDGAAFRKAVVAEFSAFSAGAKVVRMYADFRCACEGPRWRRDARGISETSSPIVIGWGRKERLRLPRQAARAKAAFPTAKLHWCNNSVTSRCGTQQRIRARDPRRYESFGMKSTWGEKRAALCHYLGNDRIRRGRQWANTEMGATRMEEVSRLAPAQLHTSDFSGLSQG